jgi:hypothetical protein
LGHVSWLSNSSQTKPLSLQNKHLWLTGDRWLCQLICYNGMYWDSNQVYSMKSARGPDHLHLKQFPVISPYLNTVVPWICKKLKSRKRQEDFTALSLLVFRKMFPLAVLCILLVAVLSLILWRILWCVK